MSIMLLTEDNLRSAKAALRTTLPRIRSAHLSEALAAALGFRTHAALLSAVRCEVQLPPELVDVDEFAFRRRLKELDCEDVDAFTLIDLARSELLPVRAYAEFRDGDSSSNDAHYHVCSRLGLPMVTVRRNRVYARVDWDCITLSPNDDDYLFEGERGHVLGRALFTRFQQLACGSQGNPLFTGTPFTGWVTGAMPATARSIAEHIFGMLYQPMREQALSRLAVASNGRPRLGRPPAGAEGERTSMG